VPAFPESMAVSALKVEMSRCGATCHRNEDLNCIGATA